MYFDPIRSAYIDTESGEVVFQEEGGIELGDIQPTGVAAAAPPERSSSIFSATVARPQSYTPLSNHRSPAVAPSPEDNALVLEQQLYDMHVSGVDAVEPTVTSPADHSVWDDWSMARTLQALEFEIPNEMFEGMCSERFILSPCLLKVVLNRLNNL